MCQPDVNALSQRTGIKPDVLVSIQDLARARGIKRVVLYGSRARGTQSERSDIDLAADGGDVLNFIFDVDEETPTILKFDVVDLGSLANAELRADIERDQVTVYDVAQA